MPYKDPNKQREAMREIMRKKRVKQRKEQEFVARVFDKWGKAKLLIEEMKGITAEKRGIVEKFRESGRPDMSDRDTQRFLALSDQVMALSNELDEVMKKPEFFRIRVSGLESAPKPEEAKPHSFNVPISMPKRRPIDQVVRFKDDKKKDQFKHEVTY